VSQSLPLSVAARFFVLRGFAVRSLHITPVKCIPLQRVVNSLLSDVQERLPDCRSKLVADAGNNLFGESGAVSRRAGNECVASDMSPTNETAKRAVPSADLRNKLSSTPSRQMH
jgi:hypothetical protein